MNTRKEIATLLTEMNLTGEGTEVGVQRGKFSTQILGGSKLSHYSMVDSWKHYPAEMYPDTANVSQEKQDAIYEKVSEEFPKKWGNRVEILRGESLAMAGEFDDGELDFVYIDANHTYDEVKKDIEAWYPKVKAGGVFAGHDYVKRKNYGVIQAVDEFALANGLDKPLVTASERSPSWVFVKHQPKTDVVIALGKGSKAGNNELRYALRSMEQNFAGLGKVWLIGEKPSWIQGVEHIQVNDLKRAKDINIIEKVKTACDAGVSEKFVFWSDDQMLVEPEDWETLPVSVLREYKDEPWYDKSSWKKQLKTTLQRFDDAKYYEPHTPMPMERDVFLDMCKTYDWEKGDCIIASLYYNHSTRKPPHNRAKHKYGPKGDIGEIIKQVGGKSAIGYSDTARDDVLRWAERAFYKQSKYETTPPLGILGRAIEKALKETGPEWKRLKIVAQELKDNHKGEYNDLGCNDRNYANKHFLIPMQQLLQGRTTPVKPCKGCGGAKGGGACVECAHKHVTTAIVLFKEWAVVKEYVNEWREGLGHLSCAEGHMTGKDTRLAFAIRAVRLTMSPTGTKDVQHATKALHEICESLERLI